MSNWKTEAELRAEKTGNSPAPKMDTIRKQELNAILTRLGSVTAVFQMRAESVPVQNFRRMSELMDIYIAGGLRALNEGQDFVHDGIKLSEEDARALQTLIGDIFNVGGSSKK